MAKIMSYEKAVENVLNGSPVEGELREVLEKLKVSLGKRNASKSGKPSKAQKENADLAERIYEAMEPGVIYEHGDICSLLDELANATPQKVSPLMKSLEGRVVIGKNKGKNTYTLADNDEADE